MAPRRARVTTSKPSCTKQPILYEHILCPNAKIVSLHLKKCFTESASELVARIEATRNYHKKRMKELEDISEENASGNQKEEAASAPKAECDVKPKKSIKAASGKKKKKKKQSLGTMFIINFKYFTRLGDKYASGTKITFKKTLSWFKTAQVLDNKRITMRDIETHFINNLKTGHELRIIEFICFIKSLCDDIGYPMATLITELLACKEHKVKKKKKIVKKKRATKVKKPKVEVDNQGETSSVPEERKMVKTTSTKTKLKRGVNLSSKPVFRKPIYETRCSEITKCMPRIPPKKSRRFIIPALTTIPEMERYRPLSAVPDETEMLNEKVKKSRVHAEKVASVKYSTKGNAQKPIVSEQSTEMRKQIINHPQNAKSNDYGIGHPWIIYTSKSRMNMVVRGKAIRNEASDYEYEYLESSDDSGEDRAKMRKHEHLNSPEKISKIKPEGTNAAKNTGLKNTTMSCEKIDVNEIKKKGLVEVLHYATKSFINDLGEIETRYECYIVDQCTGEMTLKYSISDCSNASKYKSKSKRAAVPPKIIKSKESNKKDSQAKEIGVENHEKLRQLNHNTSNIPSLKGDLRENEALVSDHLNGHIQGHVADCLSPSGNYIKIKKHTISVKEKDVKSQATKQPIVSGKKGVNLSEEEPKLGKASLSTLCQNEFYNTNEGDLLKMQNENIKPKKAIERTFTNLPVRRVQKLIKETYVKKAKQPSKKSPKKTKRYSRPIPKQEPIREIDKLKLLDDIKEEPLPKPKSRITKTHKVRKGLYLARKDMKDPETQFQVLKH